MKRHRYSLAILVLASALGCTDADGDEANTGEASIVTEEAQACVESHAPEDGNGFESECIQSPQDPNECTPVTLESVAQACEADGHPCDPDAIITREAAECLAEQQGLAPGIIDWRFYLAYNSGHDAPIWSVESVTSIDEIDLSESGQTMDFDAQTGAHLVTVDWQG